MRAKAQRQEVLLSKERGDFRVAGARPTGRGSGKHGGEAAEQPGAARCWQVASPLQVSGLPTEMGTTTESSAPGKFEDS